MQTATHTVPASPGACWHSKHSSMQRCQALQRPYGLTLNRRACPLSPQWGLQTRNSAKEPVTRNLRCQAAASALVDALPPLELSYSSILSQGPSRQQPLPPPPHTATFRDVLPYLLKLAVAEKTMYWRVAAAFCCLVVSKAAGLMCPLMIKRAVDSFSASTAAPLATVLTSATYFLLLYGVCDVTKHVAKELQAPLFTPVAQAASRRVAYHTFAHVLGLDIRFHLDRRTGRLSRILERGTRSIQMLYRAVIFTFAPTALELAVVSCVLSKRFSPIVGGLVLVTFALYTAWSIIMTQVATDARKHVNELDNATSAKAVDALLSYETVTIFNNQALEIAQYNAYLKEYMRACITTDRLAAVLNMGQSVILAVGLTAIMITALWHSGPAVSAGDMVMIQGLLLQLWAPLQFLGWFYRELRSALVDMEEFFSVLRTQSNLVDGTQLLPELPSAAHQTSISTAATSPDMNGRAMSLNGAKAGHSAANGNGFVSTSPRSGGVRLVEVEDRASSGKGASSSGAAARDSGLLVELEDVTFGYSPDRQILRGLSLRVEPGKSLALVGPSGSGKSTVLRLLTRLYDVNSGTVRLNGMDVRDIQMQSFREAVALVPQETMLFNDSILQNIRYGRPDATDEEVVDAAKLAHLHEAVMRMSKGYATVVGERGLKLSGGEKQRMAIARAFLRQPRLLICDEATSALDSATEAQIMNSLAELAVGRTSVFVAHRLSTIKDCDSIGVVKDGQLVEQGSHEELMAVEGGLYRAMWEMQAKQKAKQQAKRQAKHLKGTSINMDGIMVLDGSDSEADESLTRGMLTATGEPGAGDLAALVGLAPTHGRNK